MRCTLTLNFEHGSTLVRQKKKKRTPPTHTQKLLLWRWNVRVCCRTHPNGALLACLRGFLAKFENALLTRASLLSCKPMTHFFFCSSLIRRDTHLWAFALILGVCFRHYILLCPFLVFSVLSSCALAMCMSTAVEEEATHTSLIRFFFVVFGEK